MSTLLRYLLRGGLAVALLLVVVLVALLLIAQFKALRYPALTLDPAPEAERYDDGKQEIKASGAYVKSAEYRRFRAYRPDVTLDVSKPRSASVSLSMENIHPEATLMVDPATLRVNERIDGLSRHLHIEHGESSVKLSWRFPEKAEIRFLVMGDTGGDRELDWGLLRATELEADFVLNLGDLYYAPAEVGQVHARFNQSAVPVYATLGNHDFRGPEGNSYDVFTRNIGPMNTWFRLLDSCFINLDTAAAMMPAHGGERGRFLRGLIDSKSALPDDCERIVFTHKPFTDGLADNTIPEQGHSIDGYQASWIRKQFAKLGEITVLAGHIHDDFSFELPGIKTYVTGSGLAVEDLDKNGVHAQYLLGEISSDRPVHFQWVDNQMPLDYHCSKKVWKGLEKRGKTKTLDALKAACTAEDQ